MNKQIGFWHWYLFAHWRMVLVSLLVTGLVTATCVSVYLFGVESIILVILIIIIFLLVVMLCAFGIATIYCYYSDVYEEYKGKKQDGEL